MKVADKDKANSGIETQYRLDTKRRISNKCWNIYLINKTIKEEENMGVKYTRERH